MPESDLAHFLALLIILVDVDLLQLIEKCMRGSRRSGWEDPIFGARQRLRAYPLG